MVHVYYHIYSIPNVESIIDEQLSLIEAHFNFPFILNIGISIYDENSPTDNILKKIKELNKSNYFIRDIKFQDYEWVTLNLIQNDKINFKDDDLIFYFHTKGASRIKDICYPNEVSWRHIMNYFNIEESNSAIEILNKNEYNTYGIFLDGHPKLWWYSGNFFWLRADYVKSINLEGVELTSRCNAEINYIQNGIEWKPYSAYNLNSTPNTIPIDYYNTIFNREEYIKK